MVHDAYFALHNVTVNQHHSHCHEHSQELVLVQCLLEWPRPLSLAVCVVTVHGHGGFLPTQGTSSLMVQLHGTVPCLTATSKQQSLHSHRPAVRMKCVHRPLLAMPLPLT